MGTEVVYNGVLIHNAQIREFSQEAVWDSSHTDHIYDRFRLVVEGLVHTQGNWDVRPLTPPFAASEPFSPGLAIADPTTFIAQIRAKLMAQRAQLDVFQRFYVGVPPDANGFRNDSVTQQQTILRCVPTATATLLDPDRDVKNGPQPVEFAIIGVYGASAFRIRWVVECHKMECLLRGLSAQAPLVLNNRWSLEERLDEDHFTYRTMRGEMTLSASSWWDFATGRPQPMGLHGHLYKGVVVPGLEQGFRRESLVFNVDATGLKCTYEVTDRQTTVAPPWPCTRWDMRHTEETSENGTVFHSDVYLRLNAPPHVHKAFLITRALTIMENRLDLTKIVGLGADPAKGNAILRSASITVNTGDLNEIEARFRIMRTVTDDNALWGGVWVKKLAEPVECVQLAGQPDPYDRTKSPVPPLWGYDSGGSERNPAVLMVLHCYLQSPCYDTRSPNQGTQDGDSSGHSAKEDRLSTNIIQTTATLTTGSLSEKYSTSHKESPYTFSKVTSHYVCRPLVARMPIARTVAGDATTPGPTTICVALGPSQWTREIEYEASRAGATPELPRPLEKYTDNGVNATLIEHHMSIGARVPTPDGTTSWQGIVGHYVYALDRNPTTASSPSLNIGLLPSMNETTEVKLVPGDLLYPARLNPGTTQQSQNP